jgi:predicted metal-dependent peptidase
MSEIDIRITRARSALIMMHPFFGALAMRLIPKERNDIKTMATDGTFLYWCRAFLDKIPEAELLFVIAHEVLHCALSHMTRRNGRRWDLWQAATDYVVNLMLHQAGFKVPAWVKYFDQKYAGLNVEEVYRSLENDEKQQQPEPQPEPQPQDTGEDEDWLEEQANRPLDDGDDVDDPDTHAGDNEPDDDDGEPIEPEDQDQGDPGEGSDDASGEGGTVSDAQPGGQQGQAPSYGDPGGCGEVLDAAPPHDTAKLDDTAAEWQVYTRQAANIARRAGEGKLPGFIEEVMEELNSPQTDWRDALSRFVDPMSTTKNYSWSRPNVRLMSLGYFTPGLVSDGINHVGIAIDSSYSVDTEWLRKFGSECQGALDAGTIDKVTVMFADTEVRGHAEYGKGEIIDFTIPGRGGTAFSPTFKWVEDNLADLSAMIYFTDLDCTDFGPEPPYPVLWAAYDDDPVAIRQRSERVPFGEVIELKT